MNFWEPCWACRAIQGEIAAGIIAETPAVVVAINPFPLVAGHALVLPRQHIRDIYELRDDLAGPILVMASRIARAQKVAFGASGVTLRQNNGAASDQHLFHLHLHVIPRFDGDGAAFATEPGHIAESEQQSMARKLSGALASGV